MAPVLHSSGYRIKCDILPMERLRKTIARRQNDSECIACERSAQLPCFSLARLADPDHSEADRILFSDRFHPPGDAVHKLLCPTHMPSRTTFAPYANEYVLSSLPHLLGLFNLSEQEPYLLLCLQPILGNLSSIAKRSKDQKLVYRSFLLEYGNPGSNC
jgi:hypothetical protein